MILRATILAIALCLPPSDAQAQWKAMGIGAFPCWTWSEDSVKGGDDRIWDIQWLLGYLSAKNADREGLNFLKHNSLNTTPT
jgi:hypothetical protein